MRALRHWVIGVLGLVVIGLSALAPLPAKAQAQAIEKRVLYSGFSRTYTPLAKAHKGKLSKDFKEVVDNGLVLWVAKPARGKPTILFLHGSTKGLAKRGWKYLWLQWQGFGVVAMSYPGSSGSKGSSSTKSILAAAHRTYRNMHKWVGNGPVIIMGESLGTGVAVRLAAEVTRMGRPPAGVALQAPYVSVEKLTQHQSPLASLVLRGKADSWPSERLIRRLDVPLYIMHGGRDKSVPAWMGKRLFRASPSAQKWMSYRANEGHGSIWLAQGVREEFLAWVARAVPTR